MSTFCDFTSLNRNAGTEYLEIKCSKRSIILYRNTDSDVYEKVNITNYRDYGFFHHEATNTYYLPFSEYDIVNFIAKKYALDIDNIQPVTLSVLKQFHGTKYCEFISRLPCHQDDKKIKLSINVTDSLNNMVKIGHRITQSPPVETNPAESVKSVPTLEAEIPTPIPSVTVNKPVVESQIDTQAIFESLIMMEQCIANIRSSLKIHRQYKYHFDWRNDPDNCPPVGSDQWKEFQARDVENAVEFVKAYHARLNQ